MTDTPSALPRALAPAAGRRLHTPRRQAMLVVAIVVASLVVGTVATGAVAAARGHSAVQSGSDQLAAARSGVDRALSGAQSSGVPADLLGPVRRDESRILSESAIPNTLGIFDAGQAAHLGRQSAALRALLPRVAQIQAAATDHDRREGLALLDTYESAIAGATQAGLDTGDEQSRATRARRALAAARSPAAVLLASRDLADRDAALRKATADKIAADAAAAALTSKRDQATGALTRAQKLLADAAAIPHLDVTAFTAQLTQAQAAFSAAATQDDYQRVIATATTVSGGLRSLTKARSDAYANLAAARQTVQQAVAAGLDVGTIPAQLDSIGAQLDASGTADQFKLLSSQVDSLANPLSDRVATALLGSGKVIVINLARQDLTAYEDGHEFLRSLVTTGRPALPTPPGTTAVMSKNHPWHMVSDWPKSSPFYYPPSDVTYVLWFRAGGYGIHDAPWRSSYGPGTQAQGSHGCVNVPLGKMEALYDWADVGTRVIVQ